MFVEVMLFDERACVVCAYYTEDLAHGRRCAIVTVEACVCASPFL
jgi:hypothetical protein